MFTNFLFFLPEHMFLATKLAWVAMSFFVSYLQIKLYHRIRNIKSIRDVYANKINETLNIKTNQLARTLQNLKSQKEKSESEKNNFQNKL